MFLVLSELFFDAFDAFLQKLLLKIARRALKVLLDSIVFPQFLSFKHAPSLIYLLYNFLILFYNTSSEVAQVFCLLLADVGDVVLMRRLDFFYFFPLGF